MLKLMNDMQKLKANPINFYSTGSHSNNIIINKVIRNYPSLEHDIKFDKKQGLLFSLFLFFFINKKNKKKGKRNSEFSADLYYIFQLLDAGRFNFYF